MAAPEISPLLVCPACHGPLSWREGGADCLPCGKSFAAREGVSDFIAAPENARFEAAQKAEAGHHLDAWTKLRVGALPGVKSIADYREWLAAFYAVPFYAFGLPTSHLREATVLEIGSGPLGALACLPHKAGLAVDPLMSSFAPYMQPYWSALPSRIAALGERLPVGRAVFDAALVINCLDHTLHPEAVLAEVRRALKPGAPLFLMNNVKSPAGARLGALAERLKITRLVELYHPHAFSRRGLQQACERNGFEVVSTFLGQRRGFAQPKRNWRSRLRERVEDEKGFWVLARRREGI